MLNNDFVCRDATIKDIEQVARIHISAFPDFFLTQLGSRFLSVMYRAFLLNPASVFVVCQRVDGNLCGFAVGALQSGPRDRRLALQFFPKFIWAIIPALLRRPFWIAQRIWARFFETSEAPVVSDQAVMLRSIGVSPEAQGGGVAVALLSSFERMGLSLGGKEVALTTDVENNERAQGFYRKQGYEVKAQFCQDGDRQMYLMTKNIGNDD